ncbi:hypothetical protein [Noviherbaspirillum aridicola]|uniref:Uncharacterized protein n=1 Tax=Noviherbaspirillum aridicola TaxID=2849687 RepID=A0ABQ4Q3I6_9BURK|nr:hypothetical protein [Noviherbaspirillum aridicola]GIZ51355.1 hypothetical protein NCCP691_13690 [Noviherbaspirillum aridicola]
MNDSGKSPMRHPDEQPGGGDGTPRFGRLLLVLGAAVLAVVGLTLFSEWLYT